MAVVGHVEWVQFARVEHIPRGGEIVHAREPFEEPAGGGAVAAVQLARLSGGAALITALGDDEHGRRSRERLAELGVEVQACSESRPTRRAISLADDAGERTITTIGERLEPRGSDGSIDWSLMGRADGVYFTAGDLAALRHAREAKVLVASPRARSALGHGVPLDALVLSGEDRIERDAAAAGEPEAAVVVLTDGARGGTYRTRDGRHGTWRAAVPPGPPVDSYGCGDSFAAAFTLGLAAGLELDAALALGARCGAACLAGRGPYGRPLGPRELQGEPPA
jgi:ribokinase